MPRYLHTLSAVLFYLLGGSVFLAYILWKNEIGGEGPETWLTIADMPLLIVGALYGGLSIYFSLRDDGRPSMVLPLLIGVPLGVLVAVFVVLNFWG